MDPRLAAAARSFATTFLAVFLTLVPVAAVVDGNWEWVSSALVASLVAAVRTLLAALDPGMGLYGVGSTPPAGGDA